MTATSDGKWLGSFHPAGQFPGRDWDGTPYTTEAFKDQQKPTERVKVPSFDGGTTDESNPEAVGKSARSYIRRVQAWLRVTKLPPAHRALALYDALSDKAWVVAEELDLDVLSTSHGVPCFLEWVQTRFMDVEVNKISQLMTDLFRRCKRRPEQSVREFNVEFERMVLRLHEIRCELPPLVKAWLYVDKLRLSESEELALLASVGNEYDVRRLQHAALVQDRTLRHRGPGGNDHVKSSGNRPRWRQSVHMTVDGATSDEEEKADSETSVLVDEETAQAEHVAYMTYQGAKAKYRESLRGRGTDPDELKRRSEERLRLAKQRSYCSACKRRGHWHKDPECPLKGQRTTTTTANVSGQVQQAQVCHTVQECYMTAYEDTSFPESPMGGLSAEKGMLAIVDTACTKSVAGYRWFEAFVEEAEIRKHPYEIVDEIEHFRFGASRVHKSTFAIWAWFGIAHHWVAVKVSIVQCSVPLLLSRPALARLGTTFDIEAQQLSMTHLGVTGLPLEQSDTGHPALSVTSFPSGSPPDLTVGTAQQIWIPVIRAYMCEQPLMEGGSEAASFRTVFYPKKVPREIDNLLRTTPLACSSFFSWWKGASQSKDFWVETDVEMIRVHVSPRQYGFNPWAWQTSNPKLKNALLQCLTGHRVTECLPLFEEGVTVHAVEHVLSPDRDGKDIEFFQPFGPWIGRSRFSKTQASGASDPSRPLPYADLIDPCHAMEDEKRGHHQGAGEHLQPAGQSPLAAAGGSSHADRGQEGEPASGGLERPHEGHHQALSGGTERAGEEGGHSSAFEGHKGVVDPPAPGVALDPSGHCGSLRQVQGLAISRSTSRIPSLGGGRGQGEGRRSPSGSSPPGELGEGGAGTCGPDQSGHPCLGEGSRSLGERPSTNTGGAVGGAKLGVSMEPSVVRSSRSQELPSTQEDIPPERHGGRPGGPDRCPGPGRRDPGAGSSPCSTPEEAGVLPVRGGVTMKMMISRMATSSCATPLRTLRTMRQRLRMMALPKHYALKTRRVAMPTCLRTSMKSPLEMSTRRRSSS